MRASGEEEALRSEVLLRDRTFERLDHTEARLDDVELENCVLRGCVFASATLSRWRLDDCTFERCDLSNMRLPEVRLRGVTFIECKLLGVDFSGLHSIGLEMAFRSCVLRYASFGNLSLRGLEMRDCDATSVDFTGADLREADFGGTDLSSSLFQRTNLARAHLEGAKGYDIDATSNTVDGAHFSLEGGVSTLRRLGIKVDGFDD